MLQNYMKFKIILISLIMMTVLTACATAPSNDGPFTGLSAAEIIEKLRQDNNSIQVLYFYGEGCPICAQQAPIMNQLESEFGIEVVRFEIYNNRINQQLFRDVAAIYGIEARGVPTTFIGQYHWIGFNGDVTTRQFQTALNECIETQCQNLVQQQ